MPGADLHSQLLKLVEVERRNAEIVEASKASDDARGARIIPGYAAAHTAATDDPVVLHAWQRVQSTEQRVQALIK